MEYQDRFFNGLSKIFLNMEISHPDVTLRSIIDGSEHKCHRVILSASSEYFANVFTWNPSDVVEVHNAISGHTIHLILKYIYSGNIDITFESVSELLVAANYFSIPDLVARCIEFVLDHQDIETCIHILFLAWQLDLPSLSEKMIYFVATNFSYIVGDELLREELMSLPLSLMVLLLKSNDLVVREETSNLPTRPSEREKEILVFISHYLEKQQHCNHEEALALLMCVKWTLLNVFDETDFVLNKFASCFDEGRWEGKIKELYSIHHSEWYHAGSTATPQCPPSLDDKNMYSTRAFSCSELIPTMALARSNIQGSTDSAQFSIIAEENEHISQIDVLTYLKDGRSVVGGLKMYFTSDENNIVSCFHAGAGEEQGSHVYSVELQDGEHITGVHAHSGDAISNLKFSTSESRCVGPFGSYEGTEVNLMKTITQYREDGVFYDSQTYRRHISAIQGPHCRIPLDSVLVGFTGTEVHDEGHVVMTNVSFVFRLMLPNQKNPFSSFLIDKERKCEDSSLVMGRARSSTTPKHILRHFFNSLLDKPMVCDGTSSSF